MENQLEESGNVPRWENMDRDILSNIFKKLNVVDIIMGASRVCVAWFLASHNKTLWSTIKLDDLDSLILGNPYAPQFQDNDREKHRYHIRKILTEINKFGPTVPINVFFNVYCYIVEEDLAIISKGTPKIIKLALPMWKELNLNSIQSAFNNWKNLQTLIITDFIRVDTLSLQFQAIGENCKNLTTIKFMYVLDKTLANIIVCKLPRLERLSLRCSRVSREAAMSLIIGHPNLKILNLSHCIFTRLIEDSWANEERGMKPSEELVKTGTQKLEKLMVCSSDCTICQDVWKNSIDPPPLTPELRNFWEKQWKTDDIKELEF